MVARDDVLKRPTQNPAVGAVQLLQVLNRPQGACSRMSLVIVSHTFYVRVDDSGLANIRLKARTPFTQVVPQTSKASNSLGGFRREVGSQLAYRA